MRSTGKKFEYNFHKSVDENKIYYLRLKDSPSSFGQDSSKVRFTADNPYDNFCFYEQYLFPLELKSSKTNSFSFQRDKKEKGKNIKIHQINGLLKASKYKNIYAGFLFNFSEQEDLAVWMNIKNFYCFYTTTTKKSINLQDMKKFGCIELEKHKLKVNYTYNVIKLLDDIIRERGLNAEENI